MAKVFNSETFKSEVLESKGLVLVDFYADWCGPCKMLTPIVEEIADQYKDKLEVGKVDVDESSDLAVQYKVMSIPTLILFENGQKAETVIGLVSKEEIENMIKKHLD